MDAVMTGGRYLNMYRRLSGFPFEFALTPSTKDVLMFRLFLVQFAFTSLILSLALPVSAAGEDAPALEPLGEPAGLKRVTEDYDIWIDSKRKAVVVDGVVCLREGNLEMFACPKGTKEHESVVAVNAKPQFVHAALLAVGAKQGTPVKFDPEYKPASGQIIDIFVLWKNEKGDNKKVRAQEWVKHVKTKKEMPYNFVFAGSGFWKDDDGKEYYYADGGDFICVSNFPTATLDIPVESSQANSELLFTANTEKIPAKGTKVRLVLVPRVEEKGMK